MSQPGINLHGAVDLSGLARPPAPPARAPQSPSGGPPPSAAPGAPIQAPLVVDVTEATFEQTVALSQQVPVVVELYAAQAPGAAELGQTLTALAEESGGRFQHARVDVQSNPQIAAAFQAQAVPMVIALLGAQPVPLFQGAAPVEQIRQVMDEVLRLAAQNGITGVIHDTRGEAEHNAPEPPPPPVPPRHAEAHEALERGDLDAAIAAYRKAIEEDASDQEAPAALAQVELMQHTQGVDAQRVLAAAEAAPQDVPAQLAAADVEMSTGQVTQAFHRLLATIRRTAGEEREEVRLRMVSYFELVGPTPEVNAARRDLASALY